MNIDVRDKCSLFIMNGGIPDHAHALALTRKAEGSKYRRVHIQILTFAPTRPYFYSVPLRHHFNVCIPRETGLRKSSSAHRVTGPSEKNFVRFNYSAILAFFRCFVHGDDVVLEEDGSRVGILQVLIDLPWLSPEGRQYHKCTCPRHLRKRTLLERTGLISRQRNVLFPHPAGKSIRFPFIRRETRRT